MNRLLITGATGFLGEPAVRAVVEHFEVHATARALREPLPPGARFHACDLLSPGAAAGLLEAVRPTHLLHLAWIATPGAYWTAPENHRWVDASKELLLAFAQNGGQRAVVAGTCAEYDWSAASACREFDTPTRPSTTYGRCKLALSHWTETFGRERRIGVAWARLFWLYGPREHPARLVPSVAKALLAGEPAPCSAGTQERDFLHTEDAADALATLTRSDVTGPVNVASGESVAVREVVARVGEACGRPDLIRFGERPTPAGEPPRVGADVTRLRAELGWRPRVGLAAGLAETVAWWRTTGREGVRKCG